MDLFFFMLMPVVMAGFWSRLRRRRTVSNTSSRIELQADDLPASDGGDGDLTDREWRLVWRLTGAGVLSWEEWISAGKPDRVRMRAEGGD